jgi:hypothetical protein
VCTSPWSWDPPPALQGSHWISCHYTCLSLLILPHELCVEVEICCCCFESLNGQQAVSYVRRCRYYHVSIRLAAEIYCYWFRPINGQHVGLSSCVCRYYLLSMADLDAESDMHCFKSLDDYHFGLYLHHCRYYHHSSFEQTQQLWPVAQRLSTVSM